MLIVLGTINIVGKRKLYHNNVKSRIIMPRTEIEAAEKHLGDL